MNATETVITSFGTTQPITWEEYNKEDHTESFRKELEQIELSLRKAAKTITEMHSATNEEIIERLGVVFLKGSDEKKITALRREGLKNYRIAEILNMPESKVRAIV